MGDHALGSREGYLVKRNAEGAEHLAQAPGKDRENPEINDENGLRRFHEHHENPFAIFVNRNIAKHAKACHLTAIASLSPLFRDPATGLTLQRFF